MDNLTHSLIGAVLGQAGLKRKSGLGMPTLIIAANIPDIDAGCTVLGMVSLAMRRGITHGPIAMLVLPLLLTGAMIAFDRWQAKRGTRPAERLPVRPGWLLALAFIGCLSHPLFDWMNSYGVRLLEPFSHRWFYGDALFIVDPWLLAMLIAGVWLSRRREKAGEMKWRKPANFAIGGVIAYVTLNLGISAQAAAYGRLYGPYETMVVANPVPVFFWERDVLTRNQCQYRVLRYSPFQAYQLSVGPIPVVRTITPNRRPIFDSPEAKAFLFWSRMPIIEMRLDGTFFLMDQRFLGISSSNFSVDVPARTLDAASTKKAMADDMQRCPLRTGVE